MNANKRLTSVNPQIPKTKDTTAISDDRNASFFLLGPILQDILDIAFVFNADVLEIHGFPKTIQ
jgi:hypothetical protein